MCFNIILYADLNMVRIKTVVDYWIREIGSFFDATLRGYQIIVTIVLFTIYFGHVCEWLPKQNCRNV